MAPNLFVRAASMRGEYDSIKRKSDDKSEVRTDFILQNMFAYLIKDESKFVSMCAINSKEQLVLIEMKEIVDSFKKSFDAVMKCLVAEIEVSESTIDSVLLGIANELFCEGITWSRIISLFAFVGELTLHCLHKGFDGKIVDVIYECFRRLVDETLTSWIDDHGTWEGIRSLSKPSRSNSAEQLVDFTHSTGSGWAKSILQGTFHVIGTLASIANQPF